MLVPLLARCSFRALYPILRGMEVIDRIISGENRPANITLLEDLCHTLKFGSLCALGGFTPYPVMSALTHFPEDFAAPPRLQAAE